MIVVESETHLYDKKVPDGESEDLRNGVAHVSLGRSAEEGAVGGSPQARIDRGGTHIVRSTPAIETPIWVWVVFSTLVIGMLSVDLVVHRGKRSVAREKAYIWSAVWIGAGLLFALFIWIYLGAQAAQEYLAAYLIEKSLSLDNLFVFLIVFRNLNIPDEYQHSLLFWGVLGALVFRALFIFLGVAALRHLDWVIYVFAGQPLLISRRPRSKV